MNKSLIFRITLGKVENKKHDDFQFLLNMYFQKMKIKKFFTLLQINSINFERKNTLFLLLTKTTFTMTIFMCKVVHFILFQKMFNVKYRYNKHTHNKCLN